MDDVIFAGTADRPALGRAEVSLTIDNTSRLLPIEFTEVTFTRTLFRTGESEYQINGAPCRLLDIQELLSDTGIGRRQHVIVGQGQLDTILNARPEDRRAIIEEAAGILKYRRRKERAERRLVATEGNLLRLGDLLREVRRSLRPLERQADAARRHDGLVAEMHAITLHLAGREIASLRTREERRRETRNQLATEEQDLRVRLRALDASVLDTEHALAIPGDDDVADLLTRTEALRERARGLVNLMAERRRGFERELTAVADEGVVETLVAEAADSRAQLLAVDADWATLAPNRAEVEAAEARVEQARAELAGDDDGELEGNGAERSERPSRPEAEAAYVDAEAARRDVERDAAQQRVRGDALAQERAQADTQLGAVATQLAALAPDQEAADAAEREAAELRATVDADALVASELTPEGRAVRAAEATLQEADTAWRDAEAEASRWRARAETLALALDEERAAAGGEAITDVDGVIGPLVDHVEIEAGLEVAVAAALGDALKAIVVEGDAAARAAVERLKRGDAQAWLIVAARGGGGGQTVLASAGDAPARRVRARDATRTRRRARPASRAVRARRRRLERGARRRARRSRRHRGHTRGRSLRWVEPLACGSERVFGRHAGRADRGRGASRRRRRPTRCRGGRGRTRTADARRGPARRAGRNRTRAPPPNRARSADRARWRSYGATSTCDPRRSRSGTRNSSPGASSSTPNSRRNPAPRRWSPSAWPPPNAPARPRASRSIRRASARRRR